MPNTIAFQGLQAVPEDENAPMLAYPPANLQSFQPVRQISSQSTNSVAHVSMLHAAARDQDIGTLELLASWGVDLDAPRGDGQTAMDSTARSGYQAATQALLRLGADPRKSMHAIAGATSWGHAEILDQMLAKGGKVNQELNGMTCLRWALEMGYEDCAEVLQKYDAVGQENKPLAMINRAKKRGYRGFLKAVAEKHPEWAKECEPSSCCCFPFL